jgi:hypothetical protein
MNEISEKTSLPSNNSSDEDTSKLLDQKPIADELLSPGASDLSSESDQGKK